jgi:hypothetical protein
MVMVVVSIPPAPQISGCPVKAALLILLLAIGATAGCATARPTGEATGDTGGVRTSAGLGLRF